MHWPFTTTRRFFFQNHALKKGSLGRHLMRRLFPPIALLVLLDLGVTWVLTSRMHLEDWLLRDIFWTMLLSQLLWVALFGWVLISGLRSGLQSVERLGDAIAVQDAEQLKPLDAADLPAELRPLVDHFNRLLIRLDQNVVAQKRFIAHAAHQLRTPLSALRLESELMLSNNVLHPDMRAQVQRIHLSTERMIRLGQQLLVLARADSAASPKDRFIRLDLCEWGRTSGAEWLFRVQRKKLELQLIAPSYPVWIDADPLLLDELLGNLIDNALRYAQVRQGILLRISANPPTLSVEDDGNGIKLSDHSQLFEAFYRGEGTQSGGSGLGLAIVREIAMAHGAGWNLLSHPHVLGTRISIVFPGPRMGTDLHRRGY